MDPSRDGRAVLDPVAGAERFVVGWVEPHPDLASIVANHWSVRWDVGSAPYVQGVISHPNVQVASELHHLDSDCPTDLAEVHGVVRGTFTRELVGRGRVHGVKFRAGTFRDLLGADLTTITDRVLPAAEVLGRDWAQVASEIIGMDDDTAAAATLDTVLLDRLAAPDRVGIEVADLVDRVAEDRTILRAGQVADLSGVSPRTLQRTFARYVGVGAKWVVRTYRLHEAAERLAAGARVDLAVLAADLGYSDQAHLTNDFREATGRTPASYLAAQRTRPDPVGEPPNR